jgi:hypothetical protein
MSSPFIGLGRPLEGVEGIGPEVLEPGAHLAEPLRVDLVEPSRPDRLVADEAGLLEDAQVLRHGRPADGQAACELDDR